jgi:outer membrane protein assembly factor BamB
MTVIELGEVGAAGPEPEPRPAGPEFNPRSWRRWAAGLVGLLCLVLLGASGLPGPPMVHRVWETSLGSGYQLTVRADGVYVHQYGAESPKLIAFDLATGAQRWSREFGDVLTYLPHGAESGLLLASGDEKSVEVEFDDGSTGTHIYGGTTTALDAADGRELWRRPGEVQTTTNGTVLLGERTAEGGLSSIRLVRARDGTVVWEQRTPGTQMVTVQEDRHQAERIVLSDHSGNLTVLRYADGALVKRGRVPWVRQQPSTAMESYVAIANGLVLVVLQQSTTSRIFAYRIDTLDRVWEETGTAYAYPNECGPLICLAETDGVHGLDPLTGRRQWSLPGYSGAWQVSENRLLATNHGAEAQDHILIDPATGEHIGEPVHGWVPSVTYGQDSLVLLNRLIGEGDPVDSVSRLDVETGRVVRTGQVTAFDAGRCSAVAGYLACEWAGELTVTTFG